MITPKNNKKAIRLGTIPPMICDSSILEKIENEGVDLREVSQLLEEQGVAAFVDSFNELLQTLEEKVDQLKK